MKLLFKKLTKTSKIILIVAGLVVVIGFGLFLVLNSRSDGLTASQDSDLKSGSQSNQPKTTIRMLATGDWIAHDALNAAAQQPDGSYGYAEMTAPMHSYFARSDINFCNLATPAGGVEFGISGYPVFNAPLEWNRDMHAFGCNLINTGTNHTNDKGQPVITAMLDDWDKRQNVLAQAGANRSVEEQNKVRYFEVDGVKFAFLSYSTYSNSPNPQPYSLNRFNEPLVIDQMSEAEPRPIS